VVMEAVIAMDKMTTDDVNDVNAAFVGKTIKSISVYCNQWTFNFTDGTTVDVDTEHKGQGLYGPVLLVH
jgi:hypothetical protein